MIRGLVITVVLGAAAVGAFALATGGKGAPTYKVELDNAFGLTQDAVVRAAGVEVGSVAGLDLQRGTNRALVTVEISKPEFGDFREDVFCQVQPQSLIGEYFLDCQPGTSRKRLPVDSTIPVEQTAGTIPPDVVLNILRRPEREQLGLIFAELGIGFATREQDVQAVVQRAIPALRETDRVLDILGDRRQTLVGLTRDAEVALGALADNRGDVARFVAEARDTAAETAARRSELESTIDRFPEFLTELRPVLGDLGTVAREQTPALVDLRSGADDLTALFERLGPFARATEPAVESLGETSLVGLDAVREAGDTVTRLQTLGEGLVDPATNLRFVLEHLNDRDFAVEADPDGQRPTGFESLLLYPYQQAQAINLFDVRGYILKLTALINQCTPYAGNRTLANATDPKVQARFRQCGADIGPSLLGAEAKAGNLQRFEQEEREAREAMARSEDDGGQGGEASESASLAPVTGASGRGRSATGGDGAGRRSSARDGADRDAIAELTDQLVPGGVTLTLPGPGAGAPQSQQSRDRALLDFLLKP